MPNNTKNIKLQKLLSLGSDLAGAGASEIAGFVIGGMIGGPVGVVTGGIAGAGVSNIFKVVTDTANKQLSVREETRVGASIIFSLEKIQKKLDAGEKIRDDGFFQSNNNNLRSDAEEIFEGVLLKSKDRGLNNL